MEFDLIVRNGNVVTASDIYYDCDIGVKVRLPGYFLAWRIAD
jgi:hypothetical protein